MFGTWFLYFDGGHCGGTIQLLGAQLLTLFPQSLFYWSRKWGPY